MLDIYLCNLVHHVVVWHWTLFVTSLLGDHLDCRVNHRWVGHQQPCFTTWGIAQSHQIPMHLDHWTRSQSPDWLPILLLDLYFCKMGKCEGHDQCGGSPAASFDYHSGYLATGSRWFKIATAICNVWQEHLAVTPWQSSHLGISHVVELLLQDLR